MTTTSTGLSRASSTASSELLPQEGLHRSRANVSNVDSKVSRPMFIVKGGSTRVAIDTLP